ncbi:hypothetical protein [Priestia endophytica]|uniref:hypothetical protein n=1 Tax=Priestia endophytica TaxID=135735 RepID=UPI001A8CD28B|nr:hypothetical protein [Priestia endophytica]
MFDSNENIVIFSIVKRKMQSSQVLLGKSLGLFYIVRPLITMAEDNCPIEYQCSRRKM